MSRVTIKNILANLVTFVVLYNVLSLVVFFAYDDITPILWWLIVPFFLMQIIRAKASNAYVFTVLHVVLATIVWFVFNDWFAMGFMLVAIVYSFNAKSSGEWELTRITGIITLIAHVGMFALAQWWTNVDMGLFQQQLAGTCIVVLGFIIIYTHMDNIDLSLRVLQRSDDDRHSAGSVLRINNILIAVFSGMVVLVGVVVSALPLGRMLVAGWRAVSGLASSFFSRFAREGPTFDFPEQTPIERVGILDADQFIFMSPESVMFADEADLNNPYFALTEDAAVTIFDYYLLRIFLVVGMVIIVRNFIRYFVNLSRKRNASKSRNDEKTSLTRDILGDIRDLLPRFGRYSKNAIRRAYIKKVNWHIKRGVNVKHSDTTDIIADKIRNIEDIDELTAMYEQVRYYK